METGSVHWNIKIRLLGKMNEYKLRRGQTLGALCALVAFGVLANDDGEF